MLLHVLANLPQRASLVVMSSWTSREILNRAKLVGRPLDALGRLVLAVEACYFGGREADRSLYERCLVDFRLLAADGGARGSA